MPKSKRMSLRIKSGKWRRWWIVVRPKKVGTISKISPGEQDLVVDLSMGVAQ